MQPIRRCTSQHSTASVQPIRSEFPPLSWSIGLKLCLPWLASSMPPFGFQCLIYEINIHHEHSSYANFALQKEQSRHQGKGHRPSTGNHLLLMLMCAGGNYNEANPFRNGRGRSQSTACAIQPVATKAPSPILDEARGLSTHTTKKPFFRLSKNVFSANFCPLGGFCPAFLAARHHAKSRLFFPFSLLLSVSLGKSKL